MVEEKISTTVRSVRKGRKLLKVDMWNGKVYGCVRAGGGFVNCSMCFDGERCVYRWT